jgi:hypothetical protein
MRLLLSTVVMLLLVVGYVPNPAVAQFPDKPLRQRPQDDISPPGDVPEDIINNDDTKDMVSTTDDDSIMTASDNSTGILVKDEEDEDDDDDNIILNSTDAPTITPTTAAPTGPTAAPSMAARVPLQGLVTLELVDTPSLMEPNQQDLFEEISKAFLTFNVFIGSPVLILNDGSNQTYLSPLIDEEELTVEVLRQSQTLLINNGKTRHLRQQQPQQRSLQSSTLRPLYVTLQVSAVAREPSGSGGDASSTSASSIPTNVSEPIELPSLEDFDFDVILQQIFIENQVEYIEALQITGDDYFASIEQVNVLLESTIGDLQDLTQPPTINPDKETIAGGDDTDGNGLPGEFQTAQESSNNNTSFFTTPVIIGIAVGGGVFLCSILCCLWYCIFFRRRQQRTENSSNKMASDAGAGANEVGTPKSKPWNRRRNKNMPLDGPVDSMAEQHLMSTDTASNRPDDEASEVASDADGASLAMYSYNPRGDSGSVYTASNSIMLSGGGGGGGAVNSNHSIYGNDNMSYAYSLEPGIEASIVDGVMVNNVSVNHSAVYDDSVRSRVPIREIPQISVNGANGGSTGSNNAKASTSESKAKDDGFGDTQIETAASDLKLTPSELAMLPSNLRSGDEEEEEEADEADSKGFPTTGKKSSTKTILAPSGKLGIVIDTTVEGPVVHNVNPGSRLEGKVFPGDIIVAIDNVDTRAMSASAITALMIKTAGQQRTLKVRRADPSK